MLTQINDTGNKTNMKILIIFAQITFHINYNICYQFEAFV